MPNIFNIPLANISREGEEKSTPQTVDAETSGAAREVSEKRAATKGAAVSHDEIGVETIASKADTLAIGAEKFHGPQAGRAKGCC